MQIKARKTPDKIILTPIEIRPNESKGKLVYVWGTIFLDNFHQYIWKPIIYFKINLWTTELKRQEQTMPKGAFCTKQSFTINIQSI